MNFKTKQALEWQILEEEAQEAIKNWRTCKFSDLMKAAEIFDSALLLIIRRMAGDIS